MYRVSQNYQDDEPKEAMSTPMDTRTAKPNTVTGRIAKHGSTLTLQKCVGRQMMDLNRRMATDRQAVEVWRIE
jgi:hypothetical protein